MALPCLAELLEHCLHRRLELSADILTVTAVADVLTAASLGGGNTFCGATHLLKSD